MTFKSGDQVDLTQYEIDALGAEHNLADAYSRQKLEKREFSVMQRLPSMWTSAHSLSHSEVESKFLDVFFAYHGQTSMIGRQARTLLSYSASISMSVVATYLRLRRLKATLIMPCFDSLYDLLRQNEIHVSPIDETVVSHSVDVHAALEASGVQDVLILVDPNNPTGESIFVDGNNRFIEVVKFCVDRNILIVFDLSFAAALATRAPLGRFDIYEHLDHVGASYVAIEDTGKSWATQDLKCGVMTTSADVWPTMRDIHTSLILRVSPVVLTLLTAVIAQSEPQSLTPVLAQCQRNRAVLEGMLEGSRFRALSPRTPVSVAWLSIDNGPGAYESCRDLATLGVHVLPGTHFFWPNQFLGQRFLRVALARESDQFEAAVAIMSAYAHEGSA